MFGPRKLTVKLKGEVRVKWPDSEGVYNQSPNLLNGKSNWLQESGPNALWYDKDNENWKIGQISGLGGFGCRMCSNTGGDLPHRAFPWKYFKNGELTESEDIILFCDSSDN